MQISTIYNCFNAEIYNSYTIGTKEHPRLSGKDGESITEALEIKLKDHKSRNSLSRLGEAFQTE